MAYTRARVVRGGWSGLTSGANKDIFEAFITDGEVFNGRLEFSVKAKDTVAPVQAQGLSGEARLSASRAGATITRDETQLTVSAPGTGTLTIAVSLVANGGNTGVLVRVVVTTSGLVSTNVLAITATLINESGNEVRRLS